MQLNLRPLRTRIPVVILAVVLFGARFASAQDAVPPREWFGSQPWRQWTTATGDWNTTRSKLSQLGIDVAAAETADVTSLRSGSRRMTVTRGLFDVNVTADAKVLRIPGSRAAFQIQARPGANASDFLGDAQGFSNIDAADLPLTGELWYEQRLGSRLRAKIGKVDANSEFAYVDASSDFLSSSMGFSPSIVAMPSYPTPASSVSVFVTAPFGVEIGSGLFNGNPEDGRWTSWTSRFAIGEVGARWTLPATGLPGRATAGAWRLRPGDGMIAPAVSGSYFTAEQALWADAERGASAFLHIGTSDDHSPVRRHVGGGLAVRGATRRRPLDVTGVGATWVRLVPGDAADSSELVLEAFHRVVLTPSISMVPDLQLVRDPGGDVSRGLTAAFSCRLRLDF